MYKLLQLAQSYDPLQDPALRNVRIPPSAEALTLGRTADLLGIVSNYLISFGVIFAVIFIVWGGISFMLAQGGNTDAAKTRTTNAIIGAAVVLGVGLILKTVAAVITQRFFFF